MKALWNAILIVLFLHLLAGLLFVGWLRWSGRLNQERLARIWPMFELTIEQENAQLEDAQRLAVQAEEQAEKTTRLEQVADGPTSVADRLSTERQDREMAVHRVERVKAEMRALKEFVENSKMILVRERQDLDAQRKAFEAAVERQTKLKRDEDFERAVATFGKLKPKQVRQIFQQMVAQGKVDEVVDYLAAMQLRQSAAVLREFKSDEDIPQAAMLLEHLRDRGIDIPSTTSRKGGNG